MSELVLVFPVIAITLAMAAGLVWVFAGYLKKRADIDPVRHEPAVENGDANKTGDDLPLAA